jgi:type III restriction enzyme
LRCSNFDEHGNPIARPNTLLDRSEQPGIRRRADDNFRNMAADEIERFRRDIVERGMPVADLQSARS